MASAITPTCHYDPRPRPPCLSAPQGGWRAPPGQLAAARGPVPPLPAQQGGWQASLGQLAAAHDPCPPWSEGWKVPSGQLTAFSMLAAVAAHGSGAVPTESDRKLASVRLNEIL